MKCEKCGHESDIDLQIENMLKLAHYTAIISLGEAIKKQSGASKLTQDKHEGKSTGFKVSSFFESDRVKNIELENGYLKEKIEKAINTINLLKKMDVPEEILNHILTVLEDK